MLQSYAFNGTGAGSVVLSDSLLAIPDYAFTNCPNLRYVTIPESVVLIQPNAFDWENVTVRCYEDSFAHSYALENNISFEHTPSGIDTFSVLVHQEEFADKEQDVIAGLHRAVNPDNIYLESDLALVAIVGRGMKNAQGTAGRLCTALANAGINIKMIDQGSSELNIIVGVRDEDFERTIRAIYNEFITKDQK